MLKHFSIFFFFAIFPIFALAQNSTQSNNPYLDAIPRWQSVLTNYVDGQGRTDFKALAKNPADLNAFVAAIEKVSPDTHKNLFTNRQQILAYHINAYNALAMYGVIERGIPKNFKSIIKQASFFRFRKIIIGGVKTNLYDYENKVIRPLDEPRTHFALNCMVRDCPRLPQLAFTEENLEAMLQSASLEFFSKEKHLILDKNKKIARVSSILKFYTKDFVPSGKANDLVGYINPFLENKIPENYRVKYIKYDWTVNQQPG